MNIHFLYLYISKFNLNLIFLLQSINTKTIELLILSKYNSLLLFIIYLIILKFINILNTFYDTNYFLFFR